MTEAPATEQPAHLLVVDDDETFNRVLCRSLGQRGYVVYGARNPEAALALAKEHEPEYVVLDLNIGGESGLRLIRPLLEVNPGTRILVLTGYASIATAVEAVKLGAVQYLAKPADVTAILHALNAGESPAEPGPLPEEPMSVSRLEWEHIQRVLTEHGGNISAAARALRMHRRTLQRKLAKRPVAS
ncbi:MAG: response regulator transcription factor [Gammaproteobacteria bacterium]